MGLPKQTEACCYDADSYFALLKLGATHRAAEESSHNDKPLNVAARFIREVAVLRNDDA